MTMAHTPHERIERFVNRFVAAHPGRNTLWSDSSDHAIPIRIDDLRVLLRDALPPEGDSP